MIHTIPIAKTAIRVSSTDNPRILNLLIKLKNAGNTDGTIKAADTRLRLISKKANLDAPETVNQYLTNLKGSQTYKINLSRTYTKYCKHYNLTWNKPKYTPDTKAIRIPSTEKLDMLIASSGKTLSMKLDISKQTGMRPVELMNLKVRDVALEQRTIYPTTAKHGASRSLKVSTKLRDTIENHINRNKLTPNDKLFKSDALHYGHTYREMRNKLSDKLNDPSIRTIRLYDFRHYFATTLYHKTRDILLVKQQMGHKRIETTLIYTQLLNTADDEWNCKTAKDQKEATSLIETGFEYVATTPDGFMLFRKRK